MNRPLPERPAIAMTVGQYITVNEHSGRACPGARGFEPPSGLVRPMLARLSFARDCLFKLKYLIAL